MNDIATLPNCSLAAFLEANLMAAATAIAVTGRRKVMVMEGGYHGGLMYFGGGGTPVNAPHQYVLAPFNDPDGVAALIDAHADSLACIFVKPMMGAGGCLPAAPEFLQALRDAATRVGAIQIFDEVMTSRMSAGGRLAWRRSGPVWARWRRSISACAQCRPVRPRRPERTAMRWSCVSSTCSPAASTSRGAA
jgi:hypothetical protein